MASAMASSVLRRARSVPVELARADSNPALDGPDFWICRLAAPDRPPPTPRRLAALNAQILKTEPQRVDVLGLPDHLPAQQVRAWIEAEPLPPSDPRYDGNGGRVRASAYARLRARTGLAAPRGSRPGRFGLATAETDVRGAPTASPLLWAPDR